MMPVKQLLGFDPRDQDFGWSPSKESHAEWLVRFQASLADHDAAVAHRMEEQRVWANAIFGDWQAMEFIYIACNLLSCDFRGGWAAQFERHASGLYIAPTEPKRWRINNDTMIRHYASGLRRDDIMDVLAPPVLPMAEHRKTVEMESISADAMGIIAALIVFRISVIYTQEEGYQKRTQAMKAKLEALVALARQHPEADIILHWAPGIVECRQPTTK